MLILLVVLISKQVRMCLKLFKKTHHKFSHIPIVFYELILERYIMFTLLQMQGLLGIHTFRCY